MLIELSKSKRKNKKWQVVIKRNNKKKTIHFGDSRYSDYTLHKNKKRMELYTARHRKRENWNKSGIDTAGFWSKHLIWNKPSLDASIRDIQSRFNQMILSRELAYALSRAAFQDIQIHIHPILFQNHISLACQKRDSLLL